MAKQIKLEHLELALEQGQKKNKNKLTWLGTINSLENNFTPTAKDCNNPYVPTRLGPFIVWVYPNTFLSVKVKQATETSTGTTRIENFMISKKGKVIRNIIFLVNLKTWC